MFYYDCINRVDLTHTGKSPYIVGIHAIHGMPTSTYMISMVKLVVIIDIDGSQRAVYFNTLMILMDLIFTLISSTAHCGGIKQYSTYQ